MSVSTDVTDSAATCPPPRPALPTHRGSSERRLPSQAADCCQVDAARTSDEEADFCWLPPHSATELQRRRSSGSGAHSKADNSDHKLSGNSEPQCKLSGNSESQCKLSGNSERQRKLSGNSERQRKLSSSSAVSGLQKDDDNLEWPDTDFCLMPKQKRSERETKTTSSVAALDESDGLVWPTEATFCLTSDRKSQSKEQVNAEGEDNAEPQRRKASFLKTTLSALHLGRKDKTDDRDVAEAELYAIDRSMSTEEGSSASGVATLNQTWDSVTFTASASVEDTSRTYRSEGDLHTVPSCGETPSPALLNNNSKLTVDAHEAQKHKDDDQSKVPQSAPPVVQKRDVGGFMRKVSRKIRTTLKKSEEGAKAEGDEDKGGIRRPGSRTRFEYVDLTSDDLGEVALVKKMTYLEHAMQGMLSLHSPHSSSVSVSCGSLFY